MDNEILAKFNTSSFYLAVLFHLFVIALFMLVVSIENQMQTDKSGMVMQAAIVQEPPSVNKEEILAQAQSADKMLSRVEKKRLALAKKQAARLEQQEKKKYLAAVAKHLILTAIAEKKAALLQEKVRKDQENLDLSKIPETKEDSQATQTFKNLVEEKKNFQGTAQAKQFWQAESDT